MPERLGFNSLLVKANRAGQWGGEYDGTVTGPLTFLPQISSSRHCFTSMEEASLEEMTAGTVLHYAQCATRIVHYTVHRTLHCTLHCTSYTALCAALYTVRRARHGTVPEVLSGSVQVFGVRPVRRATTLRSTLRYVCDMLTDELHAGACQTR